jgi:hypothetical protein
LALLGLDLQCTVDVGIDRQDDGSADEFERDFIDLAIEGHGSVLADFACMAMIKELIEMGGKGTERADPQKVSLVALDGRQPIQTA